MSGTWREDSGASSCPLHWIANPPNTATRLAMAIGVSGGTDVPRSTMWTVLPVSSARVRCAEGCCRGGANGRASRHASASTRCVIRSRRVHLKMGRHSHGAGAARSSRRQNDDDVSPRDEPWRTGRAEPDGSTVSGYARASRVSSGAFDRCPEAHADERLRGSGPVVHSWICASKAHPSRSAIWRRGSRLPSRVSTPSGGQTPARIAFDSG
jgi:hypothetical protein